MEPPHHGPPDQHAHGVRLRGDPLHRQEAGVWRRRYARVCVVRSRDIHTLDTIAWSQFYCPISVRASVMWQPDLFNV